VATRPRCVLVKDPTTLKNMPYPDLITQLPVHLSLEIVRNWLDLKSLAKLDSAYCNQLLRKAFLKFLQTDQFCLPAHIQLLRTDVITWLTDRHVTTSSIGLFSATEQSLAKAYLAFCGKKVTCGEIVTKDRGTNALQVSLLGEYCPNLTRITYANGDIVTPEFQSFLRSNPQLEDLRIASLHPFYQWQFPNPIEEWTYKDITLPKLRVLSLNHSRFVGQYCLDALSMNSNLVALSLMFSGISDTELSQLPLLCPHLRALCLANARVGGDEALFLIAEGCTQIVHLDVENTRVTDAGILSVAKNLKLQSLNIQKCRHITSDSLVHIGTHCAETLHTLYLGMHDCDGPKFSHAALDTFFEQCVNIRTLSWSEEVLVRPTKPTYQFTRSIANVTTLILHWDATSHTNLTHIGTYCKQLSTLCFQWPNDGVFDNITLPELVSGCPKLSYLVAYCEDNPESEALASNVTLWGSTRQQLVVRTDFASAEKYRFDVLKTFT